MLIVLITCHSSRFKLNYCLNRVKFKILLLKTMKKFHDVVTTKVGFFLFTVFSFERRNKSTELNVFIISLALEFISKNNYYMVFKS